MYTNGFILLLFLINLSLLFFYQKISKILNIYDIPDKKRKIHKYKVPTIGGTIFVLNIFAYLLFLLFFGKNYYPVVFVSNKTIFVFFFLIFSSYFIGILDDKYNISAIKKLFLIFLIVYISALIDQKIVVNKLNFSFIKKEIFLENFSVFFTTICILLFVNAFNMFDGINGQAGLYAVCMSLILLIYGSDLVLVSLVLTPMFFFLFFNLKGKIFLGDSGSICISMFISLIFILNYNINNLFYADQIFLFLLFPGLDMLRLFLERIFSRKSPFQSDSNHIHHILIKKNNKFCTLALTIMVPVTFFILYYIFSLKTYTIIVLIILYYLFLFFKFK